MANKNQVWWFAVAVVIAALVALTAAQSGGVPSCASKLTGCVDYINATNTTPPSSCCGPLKEAVTNEKECLCNIYSNPDLLKAFNINITQAMNLPKLCKIDTGKSSDFCKGSAASPGSAQSPPGGSGSGSGSGSGNKSAADKITRTGLVSSLLVFAAYMFFN